MKIDVGQHLREMHPPHRQWEVVRIIRPRKGHRHAQLRLAADHRTIRMLSLAALEKGDAFRRVTR